MASLCTKVRIYDARPLSLPEMLTVAHVAGKEQSSGRASGGLSSGECVTCQLLTF